MKSSKRRFLNSTIVLANLLAASVTYADVANGGSWTLTKVLWGASGIVGAQNNNDMAADSLGEPLAGTIAQTDDGAFQLTSGYWAGRFGAGSGLKRLQTNVRAKVLLQDTITVGVPLNAPIEIQF